MKQALSVTGDLDAATTTGDLDAATTTRDSEAIEDPEKPIENHRLIELSMDMRSIVFAAADGVVDTATFAAEAVEAAKATEAANKFVNICRVACYAPENHPWKFEAAATAIKVKRAPGFLEGTSDRLPLTPVDCCDRNGINSLQFACARNHLPLAKMLIAAGADVDFKSRTQRSWSVLHFAVFYKNLEVVHLLLERGAILRACGASGPHPKQNPLEMAEKLKGIKEKDRLELMVVLETGQIEKIAKAPRKSVLG